MICMYVCVMGRGSRVACDVHLHVCVCDVHLRVCVCEGEGQPSSV